MVITCASHAQGPRFEPERNQFAKFENLKKLMKNIQIVKISQTINAFRPCGAMVARLTPDQKVACSTHVGVNVPDFPS